MSKRRRLKLVLLLAAINVTGCVTVTAPEPAVTYNEVVIINRLRAPLQDVSVAATGSSRVFSCGNIAPRGICSNQFPAQPYHGHPIQISWAVAGGRRYNRTFELELPRQFAPDIPLRGVIVIDLQGSITAYLQQDAPAPHL